MLFCPFRAVMEMRLGTQGVALGFLISPLWGDLEMSNPQLAPLGR